MTGYAMERLGTERLRELRHEATGDRLVGTAGVKGERTRPWGARLTLAVVRRFTRVGGAA